MIDLKLIISMICNDEMLSLIGDAQNDDGIYDKPTANIILNREN